MGLQFIEFIHRPSFKEICGSMELERKLVFVLCDNLKKKKSNNRVHHACTRYESHKAI